MDRIEGTGQPQQAGGDNMRYARARLEALEREGRSLDRRRKREEEEMQRMLAEEETYKRRQREACEREARFIRRQQRAEEESSDRLQRERQRRALEQDREENALTTALHTTSSGLVEKENSLQFEDGAVGGSWSTTSPDSLFYDIADDGERLQDLTDAELQAQMRRLQKELLQRDMSNNSPLSDGRLTKDVTHLQKVKEAEEIENRAEMAQDSKIRESTQFQTIEHRSLHINEPTARERTSYVTVNSTNSGKQREATTIENSVAKGNAVKDRIVSDHAKGGHGRMESYKVAFAENSSKKRTEGRFNMMGTIDHEIEELDNRLKRLKDESFKYKQSQSLDDSVCSAMRDKRSRDMTRLDSDRLEREPQYERRFAPEQLEEITERNEYRRMKYEDVCRYSQNKDYTYGLDVRREDEPYNSKPERNRIQVNLEDNIPRQDTEYPREERRITDRYRYEDFEREDVLGKATNKDYGRDHPLDLYEQKQLRELEEREMLKQREERLREQENLIAIKERELARKHAYLMQQMEHRRNSKYNDPKEEEIILRERDLREKLQRMKETEREIEFLETSVKSGNISTEDPRQYRLNQKPLAHKGTSSAIYREEDCLNDDMNRISTERITEQQQETGINLEKNVFFPKFTTFSGEDPKPKGEASYEEWRYEVKCIMKDKIYSKNMIGQAIRKSLRGQAKRVLLPMGTSATIEDILERLESVFGNVASGMSILQEFFTASQKQEETVAAWGLRLEEIMQKATDKGHVQEDEKNDLLKDKFWRSLRSERLKNATRIDFRTISDYEQLVKAVRTEELSMKTNANAQQQALTTNITSAENKDNKTDESKQDMLYKAVMDLKKEMRQLNRRRGNWRPWNQSQNQNQNRSQSQQQPNESQSFKQQQDGSSEQRQEETNNKTLNM